LATEKQASLKVGNGNRHVRPQPVERINHVLRGEVIDIYLLHVPAFKGLERSKVYDMVMSNPALAAECYSLFTRRPELFKHLLVDKDGAPVADEKARLSCGRSLAEVTAMVVRAVAKRHFLRRFRPVPAKTPEVAKVPISDRIIYLFKKRPPERKMRRKATRGDSLYRAMRHYLLYHWQLPLIPHYTPLPVSLVRQLGAKILEYRTASSLKVLLQEGVPKDDAAAQANGATGSVPPAAQAAPPPLIRVRLPQNDRAESIGQAKLEAMWTVAKALKLTEVFSVDEAELRRMITNASITSGAVIAAMAAHGLKMRNLVVVLCAFERQFGKARLPLMFGPQAKPAFIEAVAVLMKTHGIGEMQQPDDIKQRVEVVIRQMQRVNQLPK
jgi:hypothetical protein